MKRFRWSLQRLLDVRRQHELARRAELMRLSEEMARTQQGIMYRKQIIRTSLRELGRSPLDERISRQETVIACSTAREKEVSQFQEQLRALEAQRNEAIQRLVEIKNARESLERMREEARQLHIREQLKLEQKELDERAQVSFVRKAGRRPATGASIGA